MTLSSIKDLSVEKRVYGVCQSDTICITYESSGELSKAWVEACLKLFKEEGFKWE